MYIRRRVSKDRQAAMAVTEGPVSRYVERAPREALKAGQDKTDALRAEARQDADGVVGSPSGPVTDGNLPPGYAVGESGDAPKLSTEIVRVSAAILGEADNM